MKIYIAVLLIFIGCCANLISADTPANCTYEDIQGLWILQEGPRGNDKTVNCSMDCKLFFKFLNISLKLDRFLFHT